MRDLEKLPPPDDGPNLLMCASVTVPDSYKQFQHSNSTTNMTSTLDLINIKPFWRLFSANAKKAAFPLLKSSDSASCSVEQQTCHSRIIAREHKG